MFSSRDRDSDQTSVFEVMSRHPGMDDFERMSYMSRSSYQSKTSAARVAQKFSKFKLPP